MEKNESAINVASALGATAFHDGRSCDPIEDTELLKIIGQNCNNKTGNSIPLVDAWTSAWHAANLATVERATPIRKPAEKLVKELKLPTEPEQLANAINALKIKEEANRTAAINSPKFADWSNGVAAGNRAAIDILERIMDTPIHVAREMEHTPNPWRNDRLPTMDDADENSCVWAWRGPTNKPILSHINYVSGDEYWCPTNRPSVPPSAQKTMAELDYDAILDSLSEGDCSRYRQMQNLLAWERNRSAESK